MKVLVCGGRKFNNWKLLVRVMDDLDVSDRYNQISLVIHGGAYGADAYAGAWAQRACVPQQIFEANWEKHGRAAGPRRNKKMLVEGKPDMVLAFPGGKGTANMVKLAREAGVPVQEVVDA